MSAATASQQPAEQSDASTEQDEIDAFLRVEGVPMASTVTRSDIANAVVTLGYTAAAASVKFVVKVALRRLDTLLCVEGELQADAARKAKASGTPLAGRRPSRTSVGGWLRHLYAEDHRSVKTFLRGGWAEFGFVLATAVEETAMIVALRAVFGRLFAARQAASDSRVGWVSLHLLAPMLTAGLLSWPLRAVRTALMVNYMADTTLPRAAQCAENADEQTQTPTHAAHRYTNVVDVWRQVRQRVGLRGLLRNGLDVDMAGRVVSMTLVWTVVQPATLWIQKVGVMRTRARASVQMPTPDAAPSGSSLLLRLGQYRCFNLAALVVVVGTVNTLQRPFVVLLRRMALLPADDGGEGDDKALPGCRYRNGWDCACQVVRREGVTALFAGLPLCLLTSTIVPLVVTFSGLPTAPSFSGAAV